MINEIIHITNHVVANHIQYGFWELIPAAIGAVEGIVQLFNSNNAANTPKPDQQIPQSVLQATNIANAMATMREMPGYRDILSMLGSDEASQFENMKKISASPSGAMGSLAKSTTDINAEKVKLGIQNQNFYDKNQQGLMSQLNNQGGYEQMIANQKMQEYYNAMNTARQLQNAGIMNIANSANNVSGYYAIKKYWDQINKTKAPNTSTTNNGLRPFTTPNEGQQSPIDWSMILGQGATNNTWNNPPQINGADNNFNVDNNLPNYPTFNGNGSNWYNNFNF